jgi:molybdopterin synthase sulfur carrier subunit
VPSIVFTSALQRHVECPSETVEGSTVRSAFEAYFARHERTRTYVLDEQGALRQHVVVFVDGAQVRDRVALDESVGPTAEIYVMQALSGG